MIDPPTFWLICALLTLFVSVSIGAVRWRVGGERGGYVWHPTGVSVALLSTWGLSKLIAGLWGWAISWALYAPTDVLIGLLLASLFIARVETWKAMVGLTCLAKIAFVAANWSLVQRALTGQAVPHYNFNLTLNLLYGVELLCVLRASVEWGVQAISSRVLRDPGARLGAGAQPAPKAPREAA